MKLMFCTKCQDIVKLTYDKRQCACQSCEGYYEPDGLHATITGPALAMGLLNDSFIYALRHRLDGNRNWSSLNFNGFFIGDDSDRVTISEE